jgi:methyltransferase (TIGR00027 family)
LLNAVREPELRQVVVLGWGGDTRAYRLPWPPSVRLFELAPFDAVAHAELAFARAGVRAAKGLLLRRVAAEDSLGWTERLLAAGFMPDRTSAWALQGLHTLSREALLEVMLEVGEAAAVGSSLVGEVLLQDAETGLGAMLAGAGIQLQSWAPLQEVGASLGRTLVPEEQPRALFSAAKTRVTGRQFEAMREELQRAEGDDIGEDGFADAP